VLRSPVESATDSGQQRLCGPGGLTSTVLPVAQRPDVDIQQSRELRLTQPALSAEHLDGDRVDVEFAPCVRLPQTISFICVMFSTSSLNVIASPAALDLALRHRDVPPGGLIGTSWSLCGWREGNYA